MPWTQKLNVRQAAFVARFEKADVKFFSKVMTKAMITEIVKGPFAYQLEFPLQFLKDHAHEFDEYPTFECKTFEPNSTKRWPVKVTLRYFASEDKKRVFAYGDGGWRTFFLENHVKIDDLLVFQLIGFSRFRVYIYPAYMSQRLIRGQEPSCFSSSR